MKKSKIIAGSLVLLLAVVLAVGFRPIQSESFIFDSNEPVVYTSLGNQNEGGLKAIVKGSIYESGEEITLYGACFGPSGTLLPTSNMTLSSWYSNGSMWHNETSFIAMGDGKFRIQMNMSSIQGTYLTQATCHWQNQESIAFGEWQNPTWVAKIGDTQTYVLSVNDSLYVVNSKLDNISTLIINETDQLDVAIDAVKNDTEDIITLIGNLNVSFSGDVTTTGLATMRVVNEVYNLVHASNPNTWVLDEETSNHNTTTFSGVSMTLDTVELVSSSGEWVFYDGSSWKTYTSSNNWSAVYALDSAQRYVWAVGGYNGSAIYSVNNGTAQSINGSSATEFTDILLYFDEGNVKGFITGDNGEVWYYNGINFTLDNTLASSGDPKVSYYDDDTIYFVRGDRIYTREIGVYSNEQKAGESFVGIGGVYPDLAYAVSNNAGTVSIYYYDNSTWATTYSDNGGYIASDIYALNSQDIWVTTTTAGIFYHYDGRRWDLVNYPYGTLSSEISVSFNATTFSQASINDIFLYDEKSGYAVGSSGIILRYETQSEIQYTQTTTQLTNIQQNTTYIGNYLTTVIYPLLQNIWGVSVEINNTVTNIETNVSELLERDRQIVAWVQH